MAQLTSQTVVVEQAELAEGALTKRTALFNEDGTPFTGGGSTPVTGFTGDVVAGTDTLSFEDGVLKTVTPV